MSSTSRPNLLFVTTDHQRADSLGMVQCGIEVTPNLNRLASDAAVFTRAYNTCPLCVPARTAMATGKYPTRTGISTNDFRGRNAQDHTPLHQLLAQAGYQVAHVGVHHVRVNPPLEERVPFAKWITDTEYRQAMAAQGLALGDRDTSRFRSPVQENQEGKRVEAHYSNTVTGVWPSDLEAFKDRYFTQEAAAFLRSPPDEPWALFVCLWAPHPPLEVPEPYASTFDPGRLDLPPNVGRTSKGEPPGRRRGMPAQLAEGLSEAEWRKVWAAHLGLVRLADDCIGDLLRASREDGQDRDTVVLFTSDHGDHLGQHRMYQKMEMYEQAIRVPLVVAGPGVASARHDAPVSHLDLVPTVLDLCGAPNPGGLDGISLAAPLIDGSPPPERPVFAQYSGNPAVGDIRRTVVTQRYKYTFDPNDVPELYDLEADPLEMHNLAGERAFGDTLRELHDLCASWGRTHKDWVFQ